MPVKAELLPPERMSRILEMTKKLAAPFDLWTMLNEVLQAGRDVLEAESGSIWLYEEEKDQLRMHLPALEQTVTVKTGEGLVGECLEINEIINVRDCYADPRFNPAVDKLTGFTTRCILSIPLVGFDNSLVGVLQMLNKRGGTFNDIDEHLAVALAAQCAVALHRVQIMESLLAKQRLDDEIELAREVQMSTLPDEMPDVPGYGFGYGFLPAEYTGGDLFDLVELDDDEVFILMGDATGHGFGPALSATQMQAMFRVAFRTGATLDEAYIHVNNQLVEDLQDNKFLTAFMGFLNPADHTLRYHSAGQAPLLHYTAADQQLHWYPPTSFPVGVMEFDTCEPPVTLSMAPGDIFAVISDGVYEFHNEAGEQFGEARVGEIIRGFDGISMDQLRSRLLRAVFDFAGNALQEDDITIVLIAREQERRRHNIRCERQVSELDRIVRETHDFLEEIGTSDAKTRNDIDFAIEEIFTNCLKYNDGTDAMIDIMLRSDGNAVVCSVVDYNVDSFDPTTRPAVDTDLPSEDQQPGGLGVHLTSQLVDSFEYDYVDRTSIITFSKRQEAGDV